MLYTMRKTAILKLSICFAFCMLFSISAKSQNDVRQGMIIEDAMWVAQNCIHEATGITVKKIRPADKLDFLGITDELRLDALRRYIVRNTEIGVQSIWAVHPQAKLAQHYIISNQTFDKISKTWTVEQLAREISKNAGLPMLPLKKAAQIVADCRYDSIAKDDTPKIEIAVNSEINDNDVEKFVVCLVKNKKLGIPSAKITDPSGDIFAYAIANSIIDDKIIEQKIRAGAKYSDLITFIAENAQVPLSPELSATQLVINAILNVLSSDSDIKAFIKNKNQKANLLSFRLSEIIANSGREIKEDYTLNDLGVNPVRLKEELAKLIGELNFIQGKDKRIEPQAVQNITDNDLKDIKDTTTVGEIVDIVAAILVKQISKR